MANNKNSQEIKFHKPNIRFVLPIENFHVPKKLYSQFKKNKYEYKINNDFLKVIKLCQQVKRKDKETWINNIIVDSYYELFKIHICKSVECYENNKLIGGLYGVHLGSCFFGESMFSLKTNASKFCLLYLISILKKNLFTLLDSQFYNPHLLQFGGYELNKEEYLKLLKIGVMKKRKFDEVSDFQEILSLIQSTNHRS